jgi:nitrous oxidase accessory protein NosD
VTVKDVTIDGRGHTVANDRGEGTSIFRGAEDVAVKNVRVSGDRNGFVVASDDNTLSNRLSKPTVATVS